LIVVKAGGNHGLDMEAVCDDIAELVQQGQEVIVVHGGSHEADLVSEKLGHPARFVTSVSGFESRYTDCETLEILVMVVAGRINKSLVERLQSLGVNALGLSGPDGRLIEARRKGVLRIVENSKRKVLRGDHSGRIERINGALLRTLLTEGYTPVIAPLAISHDGGALNVDGDRVAGAIASALEASTLVILTNVPGVMRCFPDEGTVISRIPADEAEECLRRHAKGRMKKKLLGAIEALGGGVGRIVIADGRITQPLRRALAGEGTVIEPA